MNIIGFIKSLFIPITHAADIFGKAFQDKENFPKVTGAEGAMSFIINFVLYLINLMAQAAVALCVLIIIYAGFRMVISLGDEEVFKKSETMIRNALIGLFVAIMAFVIVQLTLLVGNQILGGVVPTKLESVITGVIKLEEPEAK